ncbi:hypothetical protein GINT2_002138 [Glugoides intestinalis]
MADSSDSDIIQRKRQSSRKRVYDSEDSNTSELIDVTEMEEGGFELLFYEIFGSGNEYNYIYKSKEHEVESINTVKVGMTPSEYFEKIHDTTRGFSNLFQGFSVEIVRKLIEGFSMEYLSFHEGSLSVKELYFINQQITEIQKKPQKAEKTPEIKQQTVSGLLRITEYVQNLQCFERLFFPQGHIELPSWLESKARAEQPVSVKDEDDFGWAEPPSQPQAETGWKDINESQAETGWKDINESQAETGWQGLNESQAEIGWQGLNESQAKPVKPDEWKIGIAKHFRKTIIQIATSPVFIDRVNKAVMVEFVEPELAKSSVHSLEFIQKLFCTGQSDLNDQIRKLIIEKAFEAVPVDRVQLRASLASSGLIEGPGSFQEIVDLIISFSGCKGSFAGVYFDKSLYTVVKIDSTGSISGSRVFKDHELSEMRFFLTNIDIVCLTSTSSSVRFAFQNAGINFIYVPRRFSFFDDFKDLSIPYNIALLVQNPIIYFSRFLHFIQNRYSVTNRLGVSSEVLAQAISVACATVRLDWKQTVSHKFGFTILKLLKVDPYFDPHFNFHHIDSLDRLQHTVDHVQFCNFCTFFNLPSSTNPLDHTLVHPVNYSMATVLLKSAYHALLSNKNDAVMSLPLLNIESDSDKIVAFFVSRPDLLESYMIDNDNDFAMLSEIRDTLLRTGTVCFSGAPDTHIFDDVVPCLEIGSVHSATVLKLGASFYLCNAANAIVYVKKGPELLINQIVRVEILEKSFSTLSYNGRIIEEVQSTTERFTTHSLFKNMDQLALVDYMAANNLSIAVRASAVPGCCTVVCKISQDLYFSFRLKESSLNTSNFTTVYYFKDIVYSSIDAFIDSYIKKTYKTISAISTFKYYFRTEEDAISHLKCQTEFVRYALLLSRELPGYIEFLLEGKRVFIKIDGDKFVLKEYVFNTVEEVVRFIKTNVKSI